MNAKREKEDEKEQERECVDREIGRKGQKWAEEEGKGEKEFD